MIKLKQMVIPVLISVFLFSGCGKEDAKDNTNFDPDYTDTASSITATVPQIDIEANGHIEQMSEYDSPYTVCYRNKDDTYSMYIFASPIQFYKNGTGYEIIDNTVVETKREGFAYENKANEVKMYFPSTLSEYFLVENESAYLKFKPNWNVEGFTEAKQTEFTNMYGDQVSAVIYERDDMDIALYPTKAGIKTEIVLKEKPKGNAFEFGVKSSAASYEDKQNGYILFKNGSENKNIIYGPLTQYTVNGQSQMDMTTQITARKSKEGIIVSLTIDENILNSIDSNFSVHLDPSFEIYLNKMPDSTAYSKHDVNNYLANYAVIGNHPEFGEGWHYLRFRLNWFLQIQGENIMKATYSIRNLYSTDDDSYIKILDLDNQWSSTELRWSRRSLIYHEYLDFEYKSEKYVDVPITSFVKKSFNDESWLEESHGLLFQDIMEEQFSIFATSDNALYSPYLRFDLTGLPESFVPQDNINPPS